MSTRACRRRHVRGRAIHPGITPVIVPSLAALIAQARAAGQCCPACTSRMLLPAERNQDAVTCLRCGWPVTAEEAA